MCIHGSEQIVNWFAGICTTDAVPPAPTSFNDSRCANASCCVDSTDPLLFTCELNNVLGLRVTFPNGDKEIVSIEDEAGALNLPVGFKAVSLDTFVIHEFTRNIFLTLSIANASLLDGREIICDDATPRNKVMAGCRVCGKF